jgi:hypothetical protein
VTLKKFVLASAAADDQNLLAVLTVTTVPSSVVKLLPTAEELVNLATVLVVPETNDPELDG